MPRATDFETTPRPLGAIATFVDRYPDDLRDEAFHRETNAWMFAGHRRQRAADAANDVPAIGFDVSHRTQLLVHHFAQDGDARSEISSRSSSLRQLVSKFLSDPPKHRLQLAGRKTLREHIYQLRQQWDVRAREKLFHLRCQFENVRWSSRAWSSTCSPDHAVALHARDLCPNGTSSECEFGRDLIGR